MRVWTIQGEFMGIFGAAIPRWNIKSMNVPIWENGKILPADDQGLYSCENVRLHNHETCYVFIFRSDDPILLICLKQMKMSVESMSSCRCFVCRVHTQAADSDSP